MRQSEGASFRILRLVALIAVSVGAVGSPASLLYASHNAPRLFKLLFSIWVVSPFLLLLFANMVSQSWSALTRATLYVLMLVVALGCLAAYTYRILWPPKSTAAFVFVVLPPLSWLLIAISISLAALISRRLSRRSAGRQQVDPKT